MKEETVHYRRLALLARDQKELLITGNVSSLPENIRLHEKQVFALTPILGHRNDILTKLAKIVGVKKMDLNGAVKKVPVEIAEEFNKVFAELVGSAKELALVNNVSAKLLDNAMKFSKFTLKAIREGGKKKSFSISAAGENKQPSFVNRVV
jgi:D-Tyr-tRNAtyr deacylase